MPLGKHIYKCPNCKVENLRFGQRPNGDPGIAFCKKCGFKSNRIFIIQEKTNENR